MKPKSTVCARGIVLLNLITDIAYTKHRAACLRQHSCDSIAATAELLVINNVQERFYVVVGDKLPNIGVTSKEDWGATRACSPWRLRMYTDLAISVYV